MTTIPPIPEPEGLRRLREIAEQITRQQNVRMAKWRPLLEPDGLIEIQRALDKVHTALGPAAAAAETIKSSIISPEVAEAVRTLWIRNEALLAEVEKAAKPGTVGRILQVEGRAEITSHVSGEVTIAERVEVHRDDAEAGASGYSDEQIMAAAGLLLSVHATIMGLRRGDLLDSGTLALLIAVALLFAYLKSASE